MTLVLRSLYYRTGVTVIMASFVGRHRPTAVAQPGPAAERSGRLSNPVQRRGTARAGWHASDSRLSPSLRMGHTRRPGTVRREPGRRWRLDENVHLLADIQGPAGLGE